MREDTEHIEQYRYTKKNGGPLDAYASDKSSGMNGLFFVPTGNKINLQPLYYKIIVSNEGGWDHVSVSLPHRTPYWEELCRIKDLFFREEECVVQYHPPKTDYVNNHPYCLHLWRCQTEDFPMPPIEFV